jgi:predicted transcriptional regulator
MADPATPDLLTLTAQIVAAHIAGNKFAAEEVPDLINDVYGALARVDAPVVAAPTQEPAVPVKRSIQHDYLVCLEDGAKVKTLKRYLRRFGLTPDAYRAKWGLPQNYPMVAPAYAARRSALARQSGLGTALRTAEQSALKAPHVPVKVGESTAPIPEPKHTAASVFANFPGGEVPAQAATAPGGAEKTGRKRFGQQSMLAGRRRTGSSEK